MFCRVLLRCQSLEYTRTHTQRQRVKRKRGLTCEGLSGSPQNQDPEQEGPHTSSRPSAGKNDSPVNPDSTDSIAAEPQTIDWREFRCCQTHCCTSRCDPTITPLVLIHNATQAESLCLRLRSRCQWLCFSQQLLQPHTNFFLGLAEHTLRLSLLAHLVTRYLTLQGSPRCQRPWTAS